MHEPRQISTNAGGDADMFSTGVDKGGGSGSPGPPMAGQKRIFFVKIEGLSS